ncbi:hypothetical protein F5Y18DRAFT_336155 [Xylariaceae sp. FL1019]|nr:hypothetical protein F5Y18DRAFT_336155 [Xylariaceae sp. FL1019]
MASPAGTPKTMSSRLLTMKFMQRAAASTPSSSAPSTPTSNDKSNKRRKISHQSAPEEVDTDSLVNQAAIRVAMEEEEKKSHEALLKRADELGDAHWVLDLPAPATKRPTQSPLNIIQVGYAQIDASDPSNNNDLEEPHNSAPAIRRFNMDKKKASKKVKQESDNSSSDSESDSASDSDSDSSSEPSGRQSFGSSNFQGSTAKKTLAGKKSMEKLKAKQLAEARRKKEMNLNTPKQSPFSSTKMKAGISSGGGTPGARPR